MLVSDPEKFNANIRKYFLLSNSALIGKVSISNRYSDETKAIYIEGLRIFDGFQGLGYGKLIVRLTIEKAKQILKTDKGFSGCNLIGLHTDVKNKIARHIYEKTGFKYRSIFNRYIMGEKYVYMELLI